MSGRFPNIRYQNSYDSFKYDDVLKTEVLDFLKIKGQSGIINQNISDIVIDGGLISKQGIMVGQAKVGGQVVNANTSYSSEYAGTISYNKKNDELVIIKNDGTTFDILDGNINIDSANISGPLTAGSANIIGDLKAGTITMNQFLVDSDGNVVSASINNSNGGITNTGPILGATDINSSGNLTIGGDITANGSMVIEGDFRVNGNTTIINSQVQVIKDPIIVLNDGGVAPINAHSGVVLSNIVNTSTPNLFFGSDSSGTLTSFFTDSNGNNADVNVGSYTDAKFSNITLTANSGVSAINTNGIINAGSLTDGTLTIQNGDIINVTNITGRGTLSFGEITDGVTTINEFTGITGDIPITLSGTKSSISCSGPITGASFTAGTLTIQNGNITGVNNITGNLTGDVTGDVIGNLTGNSVGIHTGNVIGDVTGNITGGSLTDGTLTIQNGNITGVNNIKIASGGDIQTNITTGPNPGFAKLFYIRKYKFVSTIGGGGAYPGQIFNLTQAANNAVFGTALTPLYNDPSTANIPGGFNNYYPNVTSFICDDNSINGPVFFQVYFDNDWKIRIKPKAGYGITLPIYITIMWIPLHFVGYSNGINVYSNANVQIMDREGFDFYINTSVSSI